MDDAHSVRPRQEESFELDATPRSKCCTCCGLRLGAYMFGATFALTLPFGLIRTGGRLRFGSTLAFANEYFLVPLPLSCMAITHQYLVSEGLWSKNKKTVWSVNWQATSLNYFLWCVGVAACTIASRRYLPSRSKRYRMMLWEYQRTRRTIANRYLPTVTGRITEDLDWYNILWFGLFYHILWGAVTQGMDKQLGAHYAMLYRHTGYSRWCSPRWREWREKQVREAVQPDHPDVAGRWGNFITYEKWRTTDL